MRPHPHVIAVCVALCALAVGLGPGCKSEDRTIPAAAGVGAEPAHIELSTPTKSAPGTVDLVEQMPGFAPLAADNVTVVRSLRALVADTGLAAVAATPSGGALAAQLAETIGIDLFDLSALESHGVDVDAPLLMATTPDGLTLARVPARDAEKAFRAILEATGGESAPPVSVGGLRGFRSDLGDGSTLAALREKGALVFAMTEGQTPWTAERALEAARADAAAWRARLGRLGPHTLRDGVLVVWGPPTTDDEAADLFGLDEGAEGLEKWIREGMTGDATFYEEEDGLALLGLRGNHLVGEMVDAVTDLDAERARLRKAYPVARAAALLPTDPAGMFVNMFRASDLGDPMEFASDFGPSDAKLASSVSAAWSAAGLDAVMWPEEGRLRTVAAAFYGRDRDAPYGLDVAVVVEIADQGGPAAASRLFDALREHDVFDAKRSDWESYPIWYLAGSHRSRGPVCSATERLLLCGNLARRLKTMLALHRAQKPQGETGEGSGASEAGQIMSWYLDLPRALDGINLRVFGVPGFMHEQIREMLAPLGPLTLTEHLTEHGAVMRIRLEGRDEPLLGALATMALDFALGM